jgi:hypothetical protein
LRPQVRIERAGRDQRFAGGIVDDLRRKIFVAPRHRQPGPARRSAQRFAHAKLTPLALST